MEVLNSDNSTANMMRKRKRTTKPGEATAMDAKRPTEMAKPVEKVPEKGKENKAEESDDSYEFQPACENCAG